MSFHVYILYSELYDIYYIGQTGNLEQRIKRHNSGAEKYTSLYCPWVVKCSIEKRTRSEAVILENKLKNLNREKLIKFITKYYHSWAERGFAGLGADRKRRHSSAVFRSMSFHVYILYSELYDIYYIGQASNLAQRIKRHNGGGE